MSQTDFSGLWIPLVTPFRGNAVDFAALRALVRRLRKDGATGFVVCGSTGEAAALDSTEQLQVLDAVLEEAGPCPVVMGVSGYHLPDMLSWVGQICSGRELAGLLVPAPNYIRQGQAGLLSWFAAIADASPVPLVVYDIPYRTGSALARETLLSLAGHPNVHAIKDCGGDLGKTLALIADGRLQVLAGEDLQMFNAMSQGAVGAIAATAHVRTAEFAQLVSLLRTGDVHRARPVWHGLVPLVEAAFAQPNPAPVKALLSQMNEMTAELRAPMQALEPSTLEPLLRAARI